MNVRLRNNVVAKMSDPENTISLTLMRAPKASVTPPVMVSPALQM